MRNKIIIAAVVALLSLALLLGRDRLLLANGGKKTDTAVVKRGNLEEKLTISGKIDAGEKVTLRFPASGRVNWVGVKEGDAVKKHQVIATQDPREVQKTLEKYLQAYMNERWDYEETKDSYKNRVLSDTMKRTLEKAQFDLNSSVLDVEIKNLSVEFSRLSTPIAGIVTHIDTPSPGVYATPTQAEFAVVNPETVFFRALADQTEVTKIQASASGELVLDAYPEEKFPGQVKDISFSPVPGESGTVYGVKFLFNTDNRDQRFRLEMAGELTFVLHRREDVLFLPAKYVKTEGDKKVVYVLRKNATKPEKRVVETGLEAEGEVEIVAGVLEGETVTSRP